MGFTNNMLTAPFTKIAANGQGDLQVALGRTTCMSHFQLVADVDSGGTRVNKINPAAKYKPFAKDVAVFSTAAAREAARAQRNYGLSMTLYGSLAAMWTAGVAYAAGEFAWYYECPRGVSGQVNEPLRAMDFVNAEYPTTRGYRSDATFQFQAEAQPNPTNSAHIVLTDINIPQTIESIGQSDLAGDGTGAPHGTYLNISQMNCGVAVAEEGGSYTYVKTFTSGAFPLQITLPNAGNSNKNYTIILFFTDQTFDGETTNKSGNYVLAAYPKITVQYVVPALDLDVSGIMDDEKKKVTVSVNTRSGTYSFYNAYLITMDGGSIWPTGTNPVPIFRRVSSFNTTPQSSSHTYDSVIPDTATFTLRVYTDSSNYLDQPFFVARPIPPRE